MVSKMSCTDYQNRWSPSKSCQKNIQIYGQFNSILFIPLRTFHICQWSPLPFKPFIFKSTNWALKYAFDVEALSLCFQLKQFHNLRIRFFSHLPFYDDDKNNLMAIVHFLMWLWFNLLPFFYNLHLFEMFVNLQIFSNSIHLVLS